MNCPDILELQSLVDRQLTPGRQQALETHFFACSVCREQAESLRMMAEALRAHSIAEALPEGLQARLLQAVATAPPVRHLSCRKVMLQLTAYIDGELGGANAAAIEAHTFTCEKCFATLSELRAVTETLAARQHTVPSEQLLARIMVAVRGEGALRREVALSREAVRARAQERTWLRRVAWQPVAVWQPVAAGLAVAVVLAAVIFPRLSPAPTWQAPVAPAVATLPSLEAPTPATAQSTSATPAPIVEQPGALARLANALTGSHRAETAPAAGPKPANGGGYTVGPWSVPSTPEPLRTPAGGPVVASAGGELPAVAPVAIATERRVAALPTATPGLAQGDEQPRARVTSAGVPTEKSRPGDIALAPRATPAPTPEPELVPRRSTQPAWEIYRSEGVDRERLALAAARLNERGTRVRMANAKNIVIIH